MKKILLKIRSKAVWIFILFIRKFSIIYATKIQHFRRLGTWPDLKVPKDFNEKLHWINLNERDPLKSLCGEKGGIRDYALQRGYGEFLNEIYGLYNDPREINWEALPRQFVIKCTHGSGFNLFCLDKNTFDRKKQSRRIKKWLKVDYSRVLNETHYANMKHGVLCERYLGNSTGELPWDYKVYCFNGRPKLILVVKNREDEAKFSVFDTEWNEVHILIRKDDSHELIARPACLYKILECSAGLSKPFTFVRVDFYIINGTPILGEMTFTPSGCMENYTRKGLQMMGDMLDL